MSWSLSNRASLSPSLDPRPGQLWSSSVNVINPVMMLNPWSASAHSPVPLTPWHMMPGHFPGAALTPEPVPVPVQALMTGRSVSVMTGSFMDDFASAVPTISVSQVDDFMTATPTSGFRSLESSMAGTIKCESMYENELATSMAGTFRNENNYENDLIYDDLTELRTDYDQMTEVIFESTSYECSSDSGDSSEGYPANFFQVDCFEQLLPPVRFARKCTSQNACLYSVKEFLGK